MSARYSLPSLPKGTVIPPEGGWTNHTAYLVDVAWRANNPIHRAILHVGFMDGPRFGNHCEVWSNCYDEAEHARGAFYLKAVRVFGKVD